MHGLLLIDTLPAILIGVGVFFGLLLIGLIVLGVFRRFVRMSWFSYEILLVFALSLVLPYIARTGSAVANFCIAAAVLFAICALVLLAGKYIRAAMLKKKYPVSTGTRVLDHIFGGVTALVNFLVFFLILGGAVLALLSGFEFMSGLTVIYENPVWTGFFGKYAADLFVIAFCMLLVRAGFRIGMLRSLQTVILFAMILLSVMTSLYLTLKWGFLSNFADTLGRWFRIQNGIIRRWVGVLTASFVVFLVFLAVILVLAKLMNILVIKAHANKIYSFIDGAILSVVFFAFFLVLNVGFNTGVAVLGNFPDSLPLVGEIGETVRTIGQSIESAVCSSPLSGLLYVNNPLRFVAG